MSDFQLGQRVKYSEHIQRRDSRPGEFLGPNRIWSNEPWPGHTLPGGEGIIVGRRTLSNGNAHYGYDESTTYSVTETFTAYLIAFDLHRKPVHVLPEHINPVDEPLGGLPTQIDDGANCIPGQADVLLELANS